MQNEKDYLNHYNGFLHIVNLKKLFEKIVGVLLVFDFFDKNVYLCIADVNEFFLSVFVQNHFLGKFVLTFYQNLSQSRNHRLLFQHHM